MIRIIFNILFIVILTSGCNAQVHNKSWKKITELEDEKWFASEEAIQIAENVLLYRRDIGGWPKNIQMQEPLSDKEKKKLIALKSEPKGCTTDNGATCQEMMFLSKVYQHHPDEKYKKAFLKGVDYLLEAQYDNGGWPQFYPLKKGYYTYITYNDDSMVNIMVLFKELRDKSGVYSIIPSNDKLKKIAAAFDKGIDCILKTQYRQNGVLTGWCAQYDEVTLQPAKARAYELPSLSGKESAKIVLLLMSIENPKKEVIEAVDAAYNWFDKVKITGIEINRITNSEGKKDIEIVSNPEAKPLWARFMELDDNTPFFCDRDGVKRASVFDIGYERRTGYAWYTNEPKEVMKKYPDWKKDKE